MIKREESEVTFVKASLGRGASSYPFVHSFYNDRRKGPPTFDRVGETEALRGDVRCLGPFR